MQRFVSNKSTKTTILLNATKEGRGGEGERGEEREKGEETVNQKGGDGWDLCIMTDTSS